MATNTKAAPTIARAIVNGIQESVTVAILPHLRRANIRTQRATIKENVQVTGGNLYWSGWFLLNISNGTEVDVDDAEFLDTLARAIESYKASEGIEE